MRVLTTNVRAFRVKYAPGKRKDIPHISCSALVAREVYLAYPLLTVRSVVSSILVESRIFGKRESSKIQTFLVDEMFTRVLNLHRDKNPNGENREDSLSQAGWQRCTI